MPSIRKVRTWCKTCQDFVLHTWTIFSEEKELLCDCCKTKDSGYSFSEVPEDKLLEQRARYKKKELNEVLGLYGNFLSGNLGISNTSFNNWHDNVQISECDAGQKKIDEIAEIDEKIKKLDKKKEELKLVDKFKPYKNLSRNDQCLCQSGKKFKNCCIKEYEGIKKKYIL